ncbi:putative protein kinase RLK-Pelle-SD-2b family [Helianthus annuus]|nr:putative protein kinase RLK-Pelle-SD-2b family [Helianthus annuus]KAJ0583240.1 putative protein kinase RLK-Pelle-SD-2b family [Helianthus annuus]KAJ0748978.1 putative protein kinase RLK-Pelle-SD-2b family [Helianthus annuus]
MLGRNRSSSHFRRSVFLLVVLRVVSSQIPLGSKLSVEEKNHWVSPNGDFAIGFFNRLNEYGIGIRINSRLIPTDKQPIVWAAGGDLRVGDKSYFELTKTGEFVLFDSTRGVTVWASKTANSSVDSALLQDDGNLVLLNTNKDIVWQSFEFPSDTLLPGQNLSSNQVLRAASRNLISSYYTLRIGVVGDLELKWENNVVYWRSASFPSRSALRALAKCLEDPAIVKRLTWRKRLDLCLAVARAVSYLHMGCREFVGHGSLSCENVVLDENLEAKVSEYGLTGFLGDGADGGGGSAKDIMDFGYVVLTVLSDVRDGGCDWAYEKWAGGNGAEIVNKTTIEGGVNSDELERVLRIMFWCLQSDERMRPTMGEIVNVLEGAMPVDPPPPPSACRRNPSAAEEYRTGSDSDG